MVARIREWSAVRGCTTRVAAAPVQVLISLAAIGRPIE
jgi:hypothetical protein